MHLLSYLLAHSNIQAGYAQADEAARRYEEQSKTESSGQQATPKFEAKDLESLTGSYHTVCCIDVLIHYPPVCGLPLPPMLSGPLVSQRQLTTQ